MKRVLTPLAVLASAMLLLTSCATGPTSGDGDQTAGSDSTATADANAFPVSIKHSLGTTEIKEEPKRVAALGWGDQDATASLGVVPVGILKVSEFGDNGNNSTDYFDAKVKELGGEDPVKFDTSDGIPFDAVAQTNPDLIMATNSGLTKEQYDRLSQIAPVVAYPGKEWTTSWQDTLKMTGEALGRTSEADEIKKQTEDKIAEAVEKHPGVKDKTFIFASVMAANPSKLDLYTTVDNRPRIIEELGLKNAPIIDELTTADANFFVEVSAERSAELESDLFISYEDKPGLVEGNNLLKEIPAVKKGAIVEIPWNEPAANALGVPSPLSIPVILDTYLPKFEEAIKAGESN